MSIKRGAPSDRLLDYRQKRSFEETPEPQQGETSERQPGAAPAGGAGELRFVVHEHHATRLHWDLRLEHDGTLASWAIPNGIPDDPKHNRKAIHVEDHPLSYLDFEGTIPAGNYGAGEVMVWDKGTYVCEKWRPDEVIVEFRGTRLRGRYVLFHAGKAEKDWMIHRMDPAIDPTAEEIPELVEPMFARTSTLPSQESVWAFEVKWDGVRAITRSQPGRIRLYSRNGNDVTAAYPELRALNRALGSHSAILDGEIVAFAEDGRPSFEALQSRMHLRTSTDVRRMAKVTPVTYVIFDLLWLDGHSLMGLPFTERRNQLKELKLDGKHWRNSDFYVGEGTALLAATHEQRLEGVIAKRLDSRYAPGRRSDSWLKIKHAHRQEVVIAGWTQGRGARSGQIGALQVGVYEGGALRYAGRVGTGFDTAELERLAALLKPLEQKSSPFVGRQPPRGAHYAKPRLVCEVEFGSWTKDGLLRQSSYKGLRDDKPPETVVRELSQTTVERNVHNSSELLDGDPSLTGLDRMRTLVEAGRRVRGGTEIELDGRTLKLTNLDKLLYPTAGFSKLDLIGYYTSIAPMLLEHLIDRPLTLKRYPDGIEGEHFYEKQCPKHRPAWVRTTSLYSESNKRQVDYCLCQDLPTLVWLANLAAIELHPSLASSAAIDCPRTLVFDLDPGRPASIVECCQIALMLRAMFLELGMRAFAKTSGSKGLQVYVPLNDDDLTYEQTKLFAHALTDVLEQRHPKLVLASMVKTRRTGKVLVDWSQNDEHKTTVSVYSLRATNRPSVSTPLFWEEVQACSEQRSPALLEFTPEQVLARVREHGDLFAEVLTLRQTLPELGNERPSFHSPSANSGQRSGTPLSS